MKVLWKGIKGLGLVFLLVVLLAGGAYVYLSKWVLTPEKLKELLQTEVARSFKGSFDCEDVQLTYWETWPTVSVAIQKGVLQSTVVPDSLSVEGGRPDLSFAFQKLFIHVGLMDYFKEDKLTVTKVEILEPTVRVFTGTKRNLFDLFLPREQSEVKSVVEDVLVRNGQLEWVDVSKDITTRLDQVDLDLKGNLKDLQARLVSGVVKVDVPQQEVDLSFPLQLETRLGIHSRRKFVDIASAKVSVERIPFEVSGRVSTDSPQQLWMDVDVNLLSSSLEDLFQYVPPVYLEALQQYDVAGSTSLKGKFKGFMGRGSYPDVRLEGKLTDGSVVLKNKKQGLDRMSMDFLFNLPSEHPDSAVVELRDLTVGGLNSLVHAQVKVKDLLREPFIDMSLKSTLNLNRLGEEFLNPETIKLTGELKSDLALVFKWADWEKGRYDRIWAEGTLDIPSLYLNSERYKVYASLANVRGQVGYKVNQSHFIQQREVLGANVHADTLKMSYKPGFLVNVTDLNLASNTGLQQDTSRMTPVTSHLRAQRLEARLFEDVAFQTDNLKLHVGVKSSEARQRGIDLAAACSSDSLEYVNVKDRQVTKLVKSDLMTEVRYLPEKATKKGGLDGFLQQSDVKGFLTFQQLNSFTEDFPLPVRMADAKLGIKNNYLILNNARVQVGKSDALVNGSIRTLPIPDSRKRFLEGNLKVRSSYLNLNELTKAYLYSLEQKKVQERPAVDARLLNLDNLEESLSKMEARSKSLSQVQNQLFRIPKHCAWGISFSADQIDLRDMQMERVDGRLNLADEKAVVNFSSRTNMGNVQGDLTYKYRSAQRADIYFTCETKHMQVGKFKKAFPEINTMFPLLYTMDGVLDSKFVTFFPVNAAMNIDLSALYATCNLRGKDMVLFNSDVYHQVATKFRFKDKEVNPIKRIDVDFLAQNNQIEVFPFVLDIDRCSFIIGGNHSMNMDFNYHIDILKSFIPIDFGVNLKGNIQNVDYELSKIKYKSLFDQPMKQEEFKMEKQRKINEAQARILKLADKL